MKFRKLAVSTFIISLGAAVDADPYTPFVCDKTGQWRLSSGEIVDTPIRFEVDYMIEMFGLCDKDFVNDEIDWRDASGKQQFLDPDPCPPRSPCSLCPSPPLCSKCPGKSISPFCSDLGLPSDKAWCTFWYITYKDTGNRFYPMQEFTPGYAVINPDVIYYPDDPNHPVNYYLPNWGYGDRAFFQSEDHRPAAEEYITQILGVIGREMREFVVDFDQESFFDLTLIEENGDEPELDIHLLLGDTPSDEPLQGYFWYYGPEKTGGNVLKTAFQLERIIVHQFNWATDLFYTKPESQFGSMGFIPVYFLMYPHGTVDTFCMDAPANFQRV